jgi:hypothetical protein
MKRINTLRRQNSEFFFNVKAGGTCSNRYALEDYNICIGFSVRLEKYTAADYLLQAVKYCVLFFNIRVMCGTCLWCPCCTTATGLKPNCSQINNNNNNNNNNTSKSVTVKMCHYKILVFVLWNLI